MADPARTVLLLAGRLPARADGCSVRALADRLERRGIPAEVLCASGGEAAGREPRVVESPGLGHRWGRVLAVRRLPFDEGLRRPDLLHVLGAAMAPVGLAIAEHWRLPYVQTIDEFLPPHARLRLSRRWSRGLIPVSRELADDLRRGLNVPARALHVVAPGVAIPSPSPAPTASGRVPVIGAAGPLVPASGLATFLAAARRVVDAGVDAEFVVAGQGEDEVDLRRRADRLGIADRVTFTEMPLAGLRFWNVLDVFCQTSIVPTVGPGLRLAMASGVPSIASDIVGLRTLVADGETGLRVPPGDPAALAATILELLADPDRARAIGDGGRALIRREFDPDDEARALVAVYRAALAADEARAARAAVAVG
jgi:glycosyltransferase involved in cell wall biosynthesis